jgi:hypothetical protein
VRSSSAAAPPRAARGDAPPDPRGGAPAVRTPGLRGDDDGRDRGRGGRRAQTVYVAFETKSGLLRALWHLLLRGDEEDAPVADRRWYQEVLEEPDPDRLARLTARNSRAGVARAADVLWTLNHPDLWLLLVGERGWTPAQWERWFTDVVRTQLLVRP